MLNRKDLVNCHRWVVKIGSSLLTADGRGLDTAAIQGWAAQISALRAAGKEVVLVSSGSVAEGVVRLGWKKRPTALHDLQAAAAVGQMGLIQTYERAFQKHNFHTAQILLTHEDLANRSRYLNARSTLRSLMNLGVIPIVNENDTVATDEIRFGDNDTLAALVANLIEADVLIILTDQKGLYERDPRDDPNAELIREADVGDARLRDMAGDSRSGLGRGGMMTKVEASYLAARSGTATLIVSGREEDVILRASQGQDVGTFLKPSGEPMVARKRWLAGHLQEAGTLQLDDGAVAVLQSSGRSLLPVGVKSVRGNFLRGDLVVCEDSSGKAIARGLTNYSALEAKKIIGQPSDRIEALLGYVDEPELIHRDNLVIL